MSALPKMTEFRLKAVLSEDAREKTVALLGSFNGEQASAVLLVAKPHFEIATLQHMVRSFSGVELFFENDVYRKFKAQVRGREGELTVDLVYPATERHISKFTKQQTLMIEESPEQYIRLTKPYIASVSAARLQWVYNILDGKAESERIILTIPDHKSGFVLLPDQKWDQVQPEELYLQAIVNRRDLSTIRDLRAEHLPLLQTIKRECRLVVRARFGVEADMLRMWLHYQPSYYHLHVHVAHTSWSGAGLFAGKAILLDDVIDNLANVDSDYYMRRTLVFTLGKLDPLLPLLRTEQ